MNGMKLALSALALGMLAAPAAAKTTMGMEGSEFVQAIRSGDNPKAIALLDSHPNVVNFRDGEGETALMIAITDRDSTWTGYLLNLNADPNMSNRDGDTPLILAARSGFDTAVDWLLQSGARVDDKNRMGETALIIAVQRRQAPIVKLLLSKGADPDKTDTAAGYSARDYAKRDGRNPEILKMLEAAHKAPGSGPSL
jgi:ankyrin repeat protein